MILKKYLVKKFQCATLKPLASKIIIAESMEDARIQGEKDLHCKGNEFIGAERISEN